MLIIHRHYFDKNQFRLNNQLLFSLSNGLATLSESNGYFFICLSLKWTQEPIERRHHFTLLSLRLDVVGKLKIIRSQ